MESSQHAIAGSINMASDKPLPKDFSHYYSITTNHRIPSAMKEYYKFFQIKGIGNLAGGTSSCYLMLENPTGIQTSQCFENAKRSMV